MELFALYGQDVNLQVNLKAIQAKYYALCKEWHPDKFSLAGTEAQEKALEMTAKINEGKKVLSNAHKRLAYILREMGVVVPEEKFALPLDFLMEMMEINEGLMELEVEGDNSKKEKLQKQTEDIEQQIFKNVASYFETKALKLNDQDMQVLKTYHYKRKYLDRIREKL